MNLNPKMESLTAEGVPYINKGDGVKSKMKLVTRNDLTKETGELVLTMPCPCSVDDVYTLGINMQYSIGSMYMELEKAGRGDAQAYRDLALKQLEIKEEVDRLANTNLNRLLWYFYNNGGPVIENPLSERMVKELQPFFNQIVSNFLSQSDVLFKMASNGNISVDTLEAEIDHNIIGMYSILSRLFQVEDMQKACESLISLRQAV
ncbi:MAG: hypothetical protein HPY50_13540 [Firmicutes bacterium]|nr:hypothetical protein [Bacillota bacterium]